MAVFCDGDFWHGKDWEERKERLAQGANSDYWVAKIEANKARDRENDRLLEDAGWVVVRLWESEIKADPDVAAEKIRDIVKKRKLDSRDIS